tara:strand:+ start:7563 stop:7937 length:375 start_codon:yes stop_codon:yes gene_type:complete
MNKEFIPYEQALELKELGFDEECLAFYHKGLLRQANCQGSIDQTICTPLYQQAFRWFRENHGLIPNIMPLCKGGEDHISIYDWEIYSSTSNKGWEEEVEVGYVDTQEEAELACLKKLIEIAKEK